MEERMATQIRYREQDCYSEFLVRYIKQGADVQLIRSLLEAGADVNAHDELGYSALLLAIKYSNEDRALFLINAGADVNYSPTAWTPLHQAIHKGWLDTIRLLAEKGADLNAKASIGFPPIILACARGCNPRQKEIIELLINLGSSIKYHNTHQYTLLHFASEWGWIKIAQLLLLRGADPNAKDVHGVTPLHDACRSNHMEIVGFLLHAGADCRLKDENGKTAFKVLIEKWPNVESVRLFIANGMYIEPDEYDVMLSQPLLKEGILQDKQICSLAILNKFNKKDLPLIYSLGIPEKMIPSIKFIEIGNPSGKLTEIELTVEREIQRKGYCNVLEVKPIILSMMCVKWLTDHYFEQ